MDLLGAVSHSKQALNTTEYMK